MKQNSPLHTIDLEPIGKRVQSQTGVSLAESARLAGIDLVTSCNGLGICGSCKVILLSGELSEPTVNEERILATNEIGNGYRLACQCFPYSDIKLYIPAGSLTQGQILQTEGENYELQFDPLVAHVDINLLCDSRKDISEIINTIRQACADKNLSLKMANINNDELQTALERLDFQARLIIRNGEVVSFLPLGAEIFGIALDIGSTKIAFYLVNLATGAIIKQSGFVNPQIQFGEDLVNRIAYANLGETFYQKLRLALIESINQHILETIQNLNIEKSQILDMTIVGNTIIHHFFYGLPVKSLGEAPYLAMTTRSMSIPANQIGIQISENAEIFSPPLIAGYVGADHSAAISASRFHSLQKTVCLIDIGTNTEISLKHKEKIISCSCASGPAFEGAHIKDGMRALPGAIETISIQDGSVSFSTIDHKPPVGICGSGMLSAAAEMVNNNIIDHRGAFVKNHPLISLRGKEKYLKLTDPSPDVGTPEIIINRSDIREIQLAKGAIRTGIELLCQNIGISSDKIDIYLIAGAFGSHLDLQSAIDIGMLPDVGISRYKQIGNAAGVGAREMLINQGQRKLLENVLSQIEYIELTTEPSFNDTYVRSLYMEKNVDLSKEL